MKKLTPSARPPAAALGGRDPPSASARSTANRRSRN